MKISTLGTFIFTALGASAQVVSFVSPTPNTHIVAGQPFTATVSISGSQSSEDILALFFGAKAVNPAEPEDDFLGQTNLDTVFAPLFQGTMLKNVSLTFPSNLPSGLDQTYNLTCGEFFTVGASNLPQIHTAQVPVFVTST